MANQSSIFAEQLKITLWNIFFGSKKNKAITFSIIAIIGFLINIRNKKSKTENMKFKGKSEKRGKGNVDSVFFKRISYLLKIVIPSWKCVEVLDLLLLTIFLVLRTFLSIYLAGVNGRIVKAIIKMDRALFIKRILNLGLVAVPASFVNSFLDFLNKRLAINFRRRLTNHFHDSYLKDMIYYQLGNLDSRVANPDQRLTSDIEKWANSLSMIYSNFSKPILDIVLFSRKLSQLVGWGGPTVVILWYFFSGVVIKLVSPSFGNLIAIQQRLQGIYRGCQTDLVHHSQQIAFYKGNDWERIRINNSFSQLTKHSQSIINKKLYMGVFDSMLVKYGAVMVGYAVVGLPVFGPGSKEYLDKIGTDPSSITRDYVRNSSLLINLAKAIGRLVISYKQVQQLAGYTTVVYEMKQVLSDLENRKYVRTQVGKAIGSDQKHIIENLNLLDKGKIIETQNMIKFVDVPIISPNGDALVENMNFTIQQGMNTLVTGPNGCGKSSLFRILGHLWPLNSGTMYRPNIDKLFYVPQRPYLPQGTLRDQIIYPDNKLKMSEKGISDNMLIDILRQVHLQYLVERQGGFDIVSDWNDVLSGGQKQRMAIGRLFYHKPTFAILDQCTSAVSLDVEAILYKTTKKYNITLFTVSQRGTLFKFHDYHLNFDGEGKWSFNKIDHQTLQN